MNNSDKRQLNCTIPLAETQEAKRDDWHQRLHLEPLEPKPIQVYYCGKFRFEFEPDDYALEATL